MLEIYKLNEKVEPLEKGNSCFLDFIKIIMLKDY